MTNAKQRMLFGHTTTNLPSRFLEEIPEENCVWKGNQAAQRQPAVQYGAFPEYGMSRGTSDFGGSTAKTAPRAKAVERGASKGYSGKTALAINQGDMVRHKAFGRGMVLSVQPMGGDALLEIAFDEVGTKRLMLNSAGAYMTKE